MHTTIYCRVGVPIFASDREVLRALRAMLTPEAASHRARAPRKALYQGVLAAHHDAQALFHGARL